MSENDEKFNIQVVHDKFEASLTDEDDIDLNFYLESFDELTKFFNLLGSVFGFVNTDLSEKMEHLRTKLNDPTESSNFQTVKRMIEHEKRNDLLNKSGHVSGSRTLLRIHRGLDFIRVFLKRVYEIEDNDDTSKVCKEAYIATLNNHHAWYVKLPAKVAMKSLPTKEQLLKRVCGDDESIKRAIELLPPTLDKTDMVFTRVETLYTIHDLHNLP